MLSGAVALGKGEAFRAELAAWPTEPMPA